jgi:hypothetical protein
MSCKGLGYKDTVTGNRLFTTSECDEMGGISHGNGECTKPEGGSWSWDCRNDTSSPSSLATTMFSSSSSSGSEMAISWTTLAGLAVGGYVLYRISRS